MKRFISTFSDLRGKETDDTCNSVHQVPCLKCHPACYSINKMCLYDHTQDGRLRYCRNALHLLECEHFQCSGSQDSSVCQHTKCVNGVQDYPYGNAEVMCPVLACVNMLRYGQRCVHPSEICDGIMVRMSWYVVPQTALPTRQCKWLCHEMPYVHQA